MTVAPCLEPARQRHPGVAGGLENDGHRGTVGDLGPQTLEVSGRRAELPRRPNELTSLVGQASPVVGPTSDVDAQPHFIHGVVLSLGIDSRLCVVDQCTLRRGVTIQTFEKQGSDSEIRPPSSRKGMHVRREARLVDDHR